MRMSKKLVVVAVSAMAVVGFTASSAMADTGVLTQPGAISLRSFAVTFSATGVPMFNCAVDAAGDLDANGNLSNVSFALSEGNGGNCDQMAIAQRGNIVICNDGSTNYLSADLEVQFDESPVGWGTFRGDINGTGDVMTFADARGHIDQYVGALGLTGDFAVAVGPEQSPASITVDPEADCQS